MKSLYKKRSKPMPSYMPSEEERSWHLFCVRNNIRISPFGIMNNNDNWRIAINLGPYKRGEKPNLSPETYNRKTIWPKYYEMCKYYYDKYRKSV
tara:strand:- start:197 stop:478 length:282 start_codon:yes stop_codon:yes gene_type:complete